MKTVKKNKQRIKVVVSSLLRKAENLYCRAGVAVTMLCFVGSAYAGIPGPPSGGGGSSGDEIQQGMTVFKEGATAGNLVMYVIAGFVYVGLLIAGFAYAKKHKEWGQFGIIAIAGAIVEVIVLIILNQIKSAIAGS